MLTLTRSALILSVSSTVSCAQPFLEFHVQGQVQSETLGRLTHVDYRMIFDTSAQPTAAGGALNFDPVFFDAIDSGNSGSDSPIRAVNPVDVNPDSPAPGLYYEPGTDRLVIHTLIDWLINTHPAGAFSPGMSSLPADPSEYDLDLDEQNASVSLISAFFDQVDWTPLNGFTTANQTNLSQGTFSVSIRVVEDPNSVQCDADLNSDGQLDFFDVSVFLQLYSNGCP